MHMISIFNLANEWDLLMELIEVAVAVAVAAN